MDWVNLIADVEKILPVHFTAGRTAIKGVTIHHMAGNLSIDDCYRVWTNNEASAHYAVQSDGKIGQLVNDWDTAWSCGNDWANRNTISIEHANNGSNPWTIGETTLDAGAHLTAAICRHYGLGEPEWMVNVFPHKHWSATACPGELAGSQQKEYMERAKAYYRGETPEVEPSPAPVPTPKPTPTSEVPPLRYRASTDPKGKAWLPEMVDHTDTGGSTDDFAGDGFNPLRWLAIDMDGWYQVKTANNGWLPKVSGYSTTDLENGCAGDGSPIIAVRAYYETPSPDATGWLGIEYAVAGKDGAWLPEMVDLDDTGGSADDFAGNGAQVYRFRARLVHV